MMLEKQRRPSVTYRGRMQGKVKDLGKWILQVPEIEYRVFVA